MNVWQRAWDYLMAVDAVLPIVVFSTVVVGICIWAWIEDRRWR